MTLRERKKLAAWHAIRAAAFEVFEDQGYDATTIDDIAAAANVSRATFFNYFDSKTAVVFEEEPGERAVWQALMRTRPQGEDLWDGLTALTMTVNQSRQDRLSTQRRLITRSPSLARSAHPVGEAFSAELSTWALTKTDNELHAVLLVDLVQAATATAYRTWRPAETFDGYLQRLAVCLQWAGHACTQQPRTLDRLMTLREEGM